MTDTKLGGTGKRKPPSIQQEEVEHVLDVLREDLRAVARTADFRGTRALRAEAELAWFIDYLAEEPLFILKENKNILSNDFKDLDYKKALGLQTNYGELVVRDERGFGRLALNTLEDAAMKWLLQLYGARTRIMDWAASTWEAEKLGVELALRAFIGERDAPLVRFEQKRRQSARKPRFDPLARIMSEAYADLTKRNHGELNARKLWRHLPTADPGRAVVADFTDDTLEYVSNFGLKEITFRAFEKRYNRLVIKLQKNLYPR